MKKIEILPGEREVSYSHGHAYIRRDGELYASLELGRESRELHSEGIHLRLSADAQAIVALPALLQALEDIASPLNKASWERDHARCALKSIGYEF